MVDVETSRILKQGAPVVTTLCVVLLVLALGALLTLGRDILVPLALAAILSFVLAPGVRALQRFGAPHGVAVVLTVVIAFGVAGGLLVLLGNQMAALGSDLPKYQGTIRAKIGEIGGAATPGGPLSRAIDAYQGIMRDFGEMTGGSKPGGSGSDRDDVRPIPVVIRDGGSVLGVVGGVVSPLLHPLATAGIVLILVMFILSSREDIRNRFVRLVGTEDIHQTTEVIDDAARRLSRLFVTQLALNASFGVAMSLGLWMIGVPSPALWGALAGVMRFVPYVGAIAGAAPPMLLAIAVDPGWSMLLWTALLIAGLEALVGQWLEPLLFGHSTGLSPLAVVVAALLWTFLWGPIGLVLATPLTVCLVVLGRHVDGLRFLDLVLGDRPPLSPPQIFYQRMLAGDPAEAVAQAKQFLRERALSTYYDQVALEALRLAHEDVARGRLKPERQDVIRRATDDLIRRFDALTDPRPRGGQGNAETAAAVLAVGPDRDSAVRVLGADELRPEWRKTTPVLCFARPGTVDEVIAKMLAQVLTKHGVPAQTRVIDTEASCEGGAAAEVKLVCLSYVEPLSTSHLRHAVRLARRTFPGARVMLGIWRERDPAMGRSLGRAARADLVVPTIGSALSAVVEMASQTSQPAAIPAPSLARLPHAA